MSNRQHPRRRAEDAPVGVARRLRAALSRGLFRTLAEDDDGAAYWVRHARHGVVLTELCSIAVLAYVLLAGGATRAHPVVLGILGLAIVGSPLLLRLPLERIVRDRRGPLFFYAWSIAITLMVSVAARLDGGVGSPLHALLFITLSFMAVTYPPYGVAAVGSLVTLIFLLVVPAPELTASGAFVAGVLAIHTASCVMVSVNAWAAYDRQAELLRSQRLLAATDELTGAPNRRAFLDRVAIALDEARQGRASVVCLVDLDGFKGVNDREGHAAGDAVLRDVADTLAGAVRETDSVARLGGDEFAVLARTAPELSGEVLAERLRAAVAVRCAGHGVTASIGLASVEPADDVESVLHRADEAMYRAKTAGGDRADTRDAGAVPLVPPWY